MAGFDRILDPISKDYLVDTSNNSWQKTRTARTAIHHAILGYRGKWCGDSEYGSRLYELLQGKSTLRTPKVLEDIITEALQRLIDAGRISAPEIITERTLDRTAIEVVVTDLHSGEELDITNLLPFRV